jgi:hypothetical protein
MKIARPLPLEYLIIDVPTGFPSADAQIQSTFNDDCSTIKTPFCVENRMQIGELQVCILFFFHSLGSLINISFS